MRHKKYLIYSIVTFMLLLFLGYVLDVFLPLLYDLYVLIAIGFAGILFITLVLFRQVHDEAKQHAANAVAVTDG
ncbi:MAG: hypothetical protein ACK4IY_06045, partial [Chitinophagales bacterium]